MTQEEILQLIKDLEARQQELQDAIAAEQSRFCLRFDKIYVWHIDENRDENGNEIVLNHFIILPDVLETDKYQMTPTEPGHPEYPCLRLDIFKPARSAWLRLRLYHSEAAPNGFQPPDIWDPVDENHIRVRPWGVRDDRCLFIRTEQRGANWEILGRQVGRSIINETTGVRHEIQEGFRVRFEIEDASDDIVYFRTYQPTEGKAMGIALPPGGCPILDPNEPYTLDENENPVPNIIAREYRLQAGKITRRELLTLEGATEPFEQLSTARLNAEVTTLFDSNGDIFEWEAAYGNANRYNIAFSTRKGEELDGDCQVSVAASSPATQTISVLTIDPDDPREYVAELHMRHIVENDGTFAIFFSSEHLAGQDACSLRRVRNAQTGEWTEIRGDTLGHRVIINWGDGSSSQSFALTRQDIRTNQFVYIPLTGLGTQFPNGIRHQYNRAGQFIITVSVRGFLGTRATRTFHTGRTFPIYTVRIDESNMQEMLEYPTASLEYTQNAAARPPVVTVTSSTTDSETGEIIETVNINEAAFDNIYPFANTDVVLMDGLEVVAYLDKTNWSRKEDHTPLTDEEKKLNIMIEIPPFYYKITRQENMQLERQNLVSTLEIYLEALKVAKKAVEDIDVYIRGKNLTVIDLRETRNSYTVGSTEYNNLTTQITELETELVADRVERMGLFNDIISTRNQNSRNHFGWVILETDEWTEVRQIDGEITRITADIVIREGVIANYNPNAIDISFSGEQRNDTWIPVAPFVHKDDEGVEHLRCFYIGAFLKNQDEITVNEDGEEILDSSGNPVKVAGYENLVSVSRSPIRLSKKVEPDEWALEHSDYEPIDYQVMTALQVLFLMRYRKVHSTSISPGLNPDSVEGSLNQNADLIRGLFSANPTMFLGINHLWGFRPTLLSGIKYEDGKVVIDRWYDEDKVSQVVPLNTHINRPIITHVSGNNDTGFLPVAFEGFPGERYQDVAKFNGSEHIFAGIATHIATEAGVDFDDNGIFAIGNRTPTDRDGEYKEFFVERYMVKRSKMHEVEGIGIIDGVMSYWPLNCIFVDNLSNLTVHPINGGTMASTPSRSLFIQLINNRANQYMVFDLLDGQWQLSTTEPRELFRFNPASPDPTQFRNTYNNPQQTSESFPLEVFVYAIDKLWNVRVYPIDIWVQELSNYVKFEQDVVLLDDIASVDCSRLEGFEIDGTFYGPFAESVTIDWGTGDDDIETRQLGHPDGWKFTARYIDLNYVEGQSFYTVRVTVNGGQYSNGGTIARNIALGDFAVWYNFPEIAGYAETEVPAQGGGTIIQRHGWSMIADFTDSNADLLWFRSDQDITFGEITRQRWILRNLMPLEIENDGWIRATERISSELINTIFETTKHDDGRMFHRIPRDANGNHLVVRDSGGNIIEDRRVHQPPPMVRGNFDVSHLYMTPGVYFPRFEFQGNNVSIIATMRIVVLKYNEVLPEANFTFRRANYLSPSLKAHLDTLELRLEQLQDDVNKIVGYYKYEIGDGGEEIQVRVTGYLEHIEAAESELETDVDEAREAVLNAIITTNTENIKRIFGFHDFLNTEELIETSISERLGRLQQEVISATTARNNAQALFDRAAEGYATLEVIPEMTSRNLWERVIEIDWGDGTSIRFDPQYTSMNVAPSTTRARLLFTEENDARRTTDNPIRATITITTKHIVDEIVNGVLQETEIVRTHSDDYIFRWSDSQFSLHSNLFGWINGNREIRNAEGIVTGTTARFPHIRATASGSGRALEDHSEADGMDGVIRQLFSETWIDIQMDRGGRSEIIVDVNWHNADNCVSYYNYDIDSECPVGLPRFRYITTNEGNDGIRGRFISYPPSHTYRYDGIFNVKYTAWGDHGLKETKGFTFNSYPVYGVVIIDNTGGLRASRTIKMYDAIQPDIITGQPRALEDAQWDAFWPFSGMRAVLFKPPVVSSRGSTGCDAPYTRGVFNARDSINKVIDPTNYFREYGVEDDIEADISWSVTGNYFADARERCKDRRIEEEVNRLRNGSHNHTDPMLRLASNETAFSTRVERWRGDPWRLSLRDAELAAAEEIYHEAIRNVERNLSRWCISDTEDFEGDVMIEIPNMYYNMRRIQIGEESQEQQFPRNVFRSTIKDIHNYPFQDRTNATMVEICDKRLAGAWGATAQWNGSTRRNTYISAYKASFTCEWGGLRSLALRPYWSESWHSMESAVDRSGYHMFSWHHGTMLQILFMLRRNTMNLASAFSGVTNGHERDRNIFNIHNEGLFPRQARSGTYKFAGILEPASGAGGTWIGGPRDILNRPSPGLVLSDAFTMIKGHGDPLGNTIVELDDPCLITDTCDLELITGQLGLNDTGIIIRNGAVQAWDVRWCDNDRIPPNHSYFLPRWFWDKYRKRWVLRTMTYVGNNDWAFFPTADVIGSVGSFPTNIETSKYFVWGGSGAPRGIDIFSGWNATATGASAYTTNNQIPGNYGLFTYSDTEIIADSLADHREFSYHVDSQKTDWQEGDSETNRWFIDSPKGWADKGKPLACRFRIGNNRRTGEGWVDPQTGNPLEGYDRPMYFMHDDTVTFVYSSTVIDENIPWQRERLPRNAQLGTIWSYDTPGRYQTQVIVLNRFRTIANFGSMDLYTIPVEMYGIDVQLNQRFIEDEDNDEIIYQAFEQELVQFHCQLSYGHRITFKPDDSYTDNPEALANPEDPNSFLYPKFHRYANHQTDDPTAHWIFEHRFEAGFYEVELTVDLGTDREGNPITVNGEHSRSTIIKVNVMPIHAELDMWVNEPSLKKINNWPINDQDPTKSIAVNTPIRFLMNNCAGNFIRFYPEGTEGVTTTNQGIFVQVNPMLPEIWRTYSTLGARTPAVRVSRTGDFGTPGHFMEARLPIEKLTSEGSQITDASSRINIFAEIAVAGIRPVHTTNWHTRPVEFTFMASRHYATITVTAHRIDLLDAQGRPIEGPPAHTFFYDVRANGPHPTETFTWTMQPGIYRIVAVVTSFQEGVDASNPFREATFTPLEVLRTRVHLHAFNANDEPEVDDDGNAIYDMTRTNFEVRGMVPVKVRFACPNTTADYLTVWYNSGTGGPWPFQRLRRAGAHPEQDGAGNIIPSLLTGPNFEHEWEYDFPNGTNPDTPYARIFFDNGTDTGGRMDSPEVIRIFVENARFGPANITWPTGGFVPRTVTITVTDSNASALTFDFDADQANTTDNRWNYSPFDNNGNLRPSIYDSNNNLLGTVINNADNEPFLFVRRGFRDPINHALIDVNNEPLPINHVQHLPGGNVVTATHTYLRPGTYTMRVTTNKNALVYDIQVSNTIAVTEVTNLPGNDFRNFPPYTITINLQQAVGDWIVLVPGDFRQYQFTAAEDNIAGRRAEVQALWNQGIILLNLGRPLPGVEENGCTNGNVWSGGQCLEIVENCIAFVRHGRTNAPNGRPWIFDVTYNLVGAFEYNTWVFQTSNFVTFVPQTIIGTLGLKLDDISLIVDN